VRSVTGVVDTLAFDVRAVARAEVLDHDAAAQLDVPARDVGALEHDVAFRRAADGDGFAGDLERAIDVPLARVDVQSEHARPLVGKACRECSALVQR
jgi:hypothetical protein